MSNPSKMSTPVSVDAATATKLHFISNFTQRLVDLDDLRRIDVCVADSLKWSGCKDVVLANRWKNDLDPKIVKQLEGSANGSLSCTQTDLKKIGIEEDVDGAIRFVWSWIPPLGEAEGQTPIFPERLLLAWTDDSHKAKDADTVQECLRYAAAMLRFSDRGSRYVQFASDLKKLYGHREQLESRVASKRHSASGQLYKLRQKLQRGIEVSGNSKLFGDHEFQCLTADALESAFCNSLSNPVIEQPMDGGRKRIDIVFRNCAQTGFFHELPTLHHVVCPYIIVEAKNYSADPANPELDQLLGRLSELRGMFGFLVCFRISKGGRPHILERCREAARSGQGWVIALDTEDLLSLVNARILSNSGEELWNILDRHYRLLTF